ncbi:fimbrial biogenesis chaperone [Quatrionicoccus australiensis]|uniref:fimbrial biogenesis chaperone n=1 Tax=Quatrionicoccus australiensis TaxID=138118 RepID=UPI001CF9950F|nr:fimbria/pilus periplasmic chaperone [Quatrionicoccus australiensis]MCB4359602.1 molecular chaperone [Quatrionicoccus australiensis]
MRPAKLILATAIALAGFAGSAQATGPTLIRVDIAGQSQTFELKSSEPGVSRYEVIAQKWTQDGVTPTREILAYPPHFTVQPGESQAIKVLARVPHAKTEGTYRLFVRAVEGGSLSFSVPVFILSTDKAAAPVITVHRDGGSLVVTNSGDKTELIAATRSAAGDKNAMLYVLPHSTGKLDAAADVTSVVSRDRREYKVQ